MFERIIFYNNNNNSYRGENAEYECTRRLAWLNEGSYCRMHIETHIEHQIKESRVVTYFVVTYRVPGSSIGDSPSTIPTAGCMCATLSSFSVSKQGPPTSLRSVTATMPDAIVHAPPNRCKPMIHRMLTKKNLNKILQQFLERSAKQWESGAMKCVESCCEMKQSLYVDTKP